MNNEGLSIKQAASALQVPQYPLKVIEGERGVVVKQDILNPSRVI